MRTIAYSAHYVKKSYLDNIGSPHPDVYFHQDDDQLLLNNEIQNQLRALQEQQEPDLCAYDLDAIEEGE